MERMLLLWDELDDLTAAVRYLVRSALEEVRAIPPPPAWGALIGQWLRLPA
jgi:hypothetical protein